MPYRPEIDGLRAFSVLLVIAFHLGLQPFSGGYIGVDIFFVISGFLITGIIIDESEQRTFSLGGFYKRRAARILPALIIALLLIYVSGFLLYDDLLFDRLGKEIVFAACGAANLLFAQGSDYFTPDISARPVIHLWSLGVEEQFYLLWPAIMLLCLRVNRSALLWLMIVLCLGSLTWAELMVHRAPVETYFYPHYRAGELLLGAIAAEIIRRHPAWVTGTPWKRESLTLIALGAIVLALIRLDHTSPFPGVNAVLPCLGTVLFLVFSQGTRTASLFSLRPVALLGLISYPLYLFHQPLIAFTRHYDPSVDRSTLTLLVLLVAVPLSWLVYRFCEKPLQRLIRHENRHTRRCMWSLGGALGVLCVVGMITARMEGLPWRFARFNAFAQAVVEHNRAPFFVAYQQGVVLSPHPDPDALFVGDSVLQQYIPSLTAAFALAPDRIDMVTRSGGVLLKGADFKDRLSTIPIRELYAHLYADNRRTYRYVFISQEWVLYEQQVGNFDPVVEGQAVTRWRSLIDATIQHFQRRGATVVLLGMHPQLSGTDALSPNLLLSEEHYRALLPRLAIANEAEMPAARAFFEQWHHPPATIVLHPGDLWMDEHGQAALHDGQWSFFFDMRHIGIGSVDEATRRFRRMIPERTRLLKAP
jgi:peptidoglycan/LPS O-acetylase OafA/YrhL